MIGIFVTSQPHDIWYANATRPFLSLTIFFYLEGNSKVFALVELLKMTN
jgi:hypothetical protein